MRGKPRPRPLPLVVVTIMEGPPSPAQRAAWAALWDKLLAPEKKAAPEGGDPDRGKSDRERNREESSP